MMQRGILSITDPRGKYMGMQTLARNFLGMGNDAKDIDISFLGPAEKPVAVVLAISDAMVRNNDPLTTYVKGDYFFNSTDENFRTISSARLPTLRLPIDMEAASHRNMTCAAFSADCPG